MTALCLLVQSFVLVAGEVDDALARAEFGFYAGETGVIESAIGALERASDHGSDVRRLAHLGYARWKLAQLRSSRDREGAIAAAEGCASVLAEATALDPQLAETQAVQSACYGLLARLQGLLKSAVNDRRSGKCLNAAIALAPGNPRVLLIEGLDAYERAPDSGGDKGRAYHKFEAAVMAFESEGAGVAETWGHAEALAWLGRAYLDQGNPVAAREALERALIVAPDYRWATELLAGITNPR